MKLTTRNNLNFLSISLVIFILWISFFYFFLRHQVEQNINFELEKRKSELLMQMNAGTFHQTEVIEYLDSRIHISQTKRNNLSQTEIKDTVLLNTQNRKFIPYRKISFVAQIQNTPYKIDIFKSLEESDRLIVKMLLLSTFVVIVLISLLFLLNYMSSRNIWKSFYNTLKQIHGYEIHSQKTLSLEPSEVVEFQDLNKVLNQMTEKIQDDYRKLKEFTENASHEIQNPLAIIHTKMEVLLQSENLNEKQFCAINDVYEAVNRLSRLNQTLLLLTKIENRQFPNAEVINISESLNKILEQFEDSIKQKQLKIHIDIASKSTITINPYLSDILFSNLIKNTIRHNIYQGNINIEGRSEYLKISNTGSEIPIDTQQVFERFHKASKAKESLGLGLSLVKTICEIYQFQIHYEQQNNIHSVTIAFMV